MKSQIEKILLGYWEYYENHGEYPKMITMGSRIFEAVKNECVLRETKGITPDNLNDGKFLDMIVKVGGCKCCFNFS